MEEFLTVERGAEFLDERLPGWNRKINLDTLDLSDSCNCVLGQLHRRGPRYSRYAQGLKKLRLGWEGNGPAPSRYGFVVHGRGRFENLTEAWRRLILRRCGELS